MVLNSGKRSDRESMVVGISPTFENGSTGVISCLSELIAKPSSGPGGGPSGRRRKRAPAAGCGDRRNEASDKVN